MIITPCNSKIHVQDWLPPFFLCPQIQVGQYGVETSEALSVKSEATVSVMQN